jgi:probable phosphoglycerate mutase
VGGEPWGNAAFEDPEQMLLFTNDPEKWNIEGGEPFAALKARMTKVILELAEKHDGQTVACISHGMAIRSLISGIKGISSENIHEIRHGDNTCVALLQCSDGNIDIAFYNDNQHLPHEESTFAGQDWWKNKYKADYSNLRFTPMDLSRDSELYSRCYRDGWEAAHGTMKGYSDSRCLRTAMRVSAALPASLMKAYSGEDFAGIIELDLERMSEDGAGWISLCYLCPQFRGRGFGVQLLGHAVSVYRNLGRKTLRLHVSEKNGRGIAFYEKHGFRRTGTASGAVAPLILMEMEICQMPS